MSGQHVSDMAMSFVEMAKAFEELPKVKAELAEANRAFNHASDTIQRLELKLIDRNTTIDELHAKIREAEVARDDAELRFLEADEKLGNVAKALAVAADVVRVAEPVKPLEATQDESPLPSSNGSIESLPEPSVSQENISSELIAPEPFSPESSLTDLVEVREEPRPLDVQAQESTNGDGVHSQDVGGHNDASAGQSDPLPTVASPIDALPAGSTNANPSADASSPIDDPSYANEPYDKWSVAWTKWAERMDAKFGRYNWPIRTAMA